MGKGLVTRRPLPTRRPPEVSSYRCRSVAGWPSADHPTAGARHRPEHAAADAALRRAGRGWEVAGCRRHRPGPELPDAGSFRPLDDARMVRPAPAMTAPGRGRVRRVPIVRAHRPRRPRRRPGGHARREGVDQDRRDPRRAGADAVPAIRGSPARRVVREAETLETASQNALLKSLEEPPPATVFILTTSVPAAPAADGAVAIDDAALRGAVAGGGGRGARTRPRILGGRGPGAGRAGRRQHRTGAGARRHRRRRMLRETALLLLQQGAGRRRARRGSRWRPAWSGRPGRSARARSWR